MDLILLCSRCKRSMASYEFFANEECISNGGFEYECIDCWDRLVSAEKEGGAPIIELEPHIFLVSAATTG